MSEWTISTLKDRFDDLRKADQEAVAAAFEAAKEKSASHNDLIHAMERQQATFADKETTDRRLLAIETEQAANRNKTLGMGQLLSVAIAVVVAIGALLAVLKYVPVAS